MEAAFGYVAWRQCLRANEAGRMCMIRGRWLTHGSDPTSLSIRDAMYRIASKPRSDSIEDRSTLNFDQDEMSRALVLAAGREDKHCR